MALGKEALVAWRLQEARSFRQRSCDDEPLQGSDGDDISKGQAPSNEHSRESKRRSQR